MLFHHKMTKYQSNYKYNNQTINIIITIWTLWMFNQKAKIQICQNKLHVKTFRISTA